MGIIRKLNNISCKKYCDINNYKYSIFQKEHLQKVYIPQYIDNPEAISSVDVNYPEIYISELFDVNLIGANYIIFDTNNYCIYDLPFMDDENKFDLRCNNTYAIDRNTTFINYTDSFESITEGIMLIAGFSFNFSHFQIDVLSKLCLIDKIDEYKNLPILIDEICLTIPQYREELNMLNKQGRKIISLKKGFSYNIKKLIYISDLGIYPCNIKANFLLRYKDSVINELAVKLLSSSLSISNNTLFRKLFISRSRTGNPRLKNHDAVEEIFKARGYEVIFPELMSFSDKLKIFSEAEIVSGVYGAGFTNILFSNKNTKIVCIQPKAIQAPWISNIAGILGQQYFFLDAKLYENPQCRYYESSFIVDEEYLKKFLDSFN